MVLALVATPATASPNGSAPPTPTGGPLPLSPGAANLVANGDFETGAYAPQWTPSPGGPFDQVCKVGTPIGAATCEAHRGQYAMSFGLAGAQDTMSQTLTTAPGQSYLLTFWLANDNPGDANTTTFAVAWGGSTVYSLPSPQPTFAYRQVAIAVTATSASTQLAFLAQQDPSQWFLDDVRVVPLQPPASVPAVNDWSAGLLALLMAGIAAGYLTRRRIARS
jgi:hypothetical protein